ncbi:MAG: DUF1571 domain-containing protein [Planctomycetes bacterium]|nr:DUF1571 domain-containing protein [Planctomycetota bacterium]
MSCCKCLNRYRYVLVVLMSLLVMLSFALAAPAGKAESDTKNRLLDPIKKFFSADKSDISDEDFLDFAANDYGKLLEVMKANYDSSIVDYTGIFTKQERVKKKLRKLQVISFKFRNKPFSIFMKWKKNPGKADRMLYVKGQNNNKMVVHPRGLLGFIKSVERDPRSKSILKTSLRTCDQFGIRNLLNRVTGLYKGNMKDKGFSAKYIGTEEIDKRPCIVLETIMPNNKISPTRRLILVMDMRYRLPVSITSLDGKGNLISKYSYTGLKFNNGLKDKDFTKKANKL